MLFPWEDHEQMHAKLDPMVPKRSLQALRK